MNQAFLDILEMKLSGALEHSGDKRLAGYWCDGILLPVFPEFYSKKYVNDHRKIVFTAFLGYTGQEQYELTLHFGNHSLSRYTRGLDISECFEPAALNYGVEILTTEKKINIFLK